MPRDGIMKPQAADKVQMKKGLTEPREGCHVSEAADETPNKAWSWFSKKLKKLVSITRHSNDVSPSLCPSLDDDSSSQGTPAEISHINVYPRHQVCAQDSLFPDSNAASPRTSSRLLLSSSELSYGSLSCGGAGPAINPSPPADPCPSYRRRTSCPALPQMPAGHHHQSSGGHQHQVSEGQHQQQQAAAALFGCTVGPRLAASRSMQLLLNTASTDRRRPHHKPSLLTPSEEGGTEEGYGDNPLDFSTSRAPSGPSSARSSWSGLSSALHHRRWTDDQSQLPNSMPSESVPSAACPSSCSAQRQADLVVHLHFGGAGTCSGGSSIGSGSGRTSFESEQSGSGASGSGPPGSTATSSSRTSREYPEEARSSLPLPASAKYGFERRSYSRRHSLAVIVEPSALPFHQAHHGLDASCPLGAGMIQPGSYHTDGGAGIEGEMRLRQISPWDGQQVTHRQERSVCLRRTISYAQASRSSRLRSVSGGTKPAVDPSEISEPLYKIGEP